jgi:hypothetical protein
MGRKQGLPGQQDLDIFNHMARQPFGDYSGVENFPGLENIDQSWVNAATGNERKQLTEMLDLADFRDLGFAEAGVGRYGVSDEHLRNLIDPRTGQPSSYMMGHSVFELDPQGRTFRPTENIHPAYNQHNVGTFHGQMMEPVPLDVMFGDDVMEGVIPSAVSRKMMMNPPTKIMGNEDADRIWQYYESLKPGVSRETFNMRQPSYRGFLPPEGQ